MSEVLCHMKKVVGLTPEPNTKFEDVAQNYSGSSGSNDGMI